MEVSFLDDGKHLSVVGNELEEIPADLGEKYGPKVSQLDLSNNVIKKISHLSKFTVLDTLVLDNNKLTSKQDFPKIKTLKTLCVNNNEITELGVFLDSVSPAFPNLTYLSLLKNPSCPNYFTGKEQADYQRYRYFVLHKLPHLKYLDYTPVTSEEQKEAERVGKYIGQVIRPSEEEYKKPKKAEEDEKIKALPSDLRPSDKPGGASFGVSRYVYYGRQSEGNRFIKDDQL